jgi:hypothetical protein
MINRLKECRPIATRYPRRLPNDLASVTIAAMLWFLPRGEEW